MLETARLEPVDDLALPLPQRGALQRLERDDAAFDFLRFAARGLRGLGEFALAAAFGLQRGDEFVHLLACSLVLLARCGFLAFQGCERGGDVGRRQRAVFLGGAVPLVQQAAQLVLHHFETGTLGACGRRGLPQRLVEAFPVFLPARHRGFGRREFGRGGLFGGARLLEARTHFGQRRLEFGSKLAVAHAVQVRVLDALRDLVEFLSLARADFTRVVDGLFGARDVGADLVVAPLHFGQHGRLRVVLLPRALDGGFDRPLLRQRGLQRKVTLAQDRLARARFALDFAQLEREQFGVRLPFFLLQRLVAARGGGLALQVTQLLFDFVTQVGQARQVFARLRDAAFRFLAALLVARDARGFLEEGAHVVGFRLDHARDHVLFDDRVAARTEAGAEEQLRDVLATAAHAVQEIRRLAVARRRRA